ncbi:hypothetical protein [Clostridium tagluense]|uniref:hypothetical protein n=1 Tax=Clostridium tagluense TaxID=360422 RepID=UPI001C6EC015|nr:hypothetical protein [Clostridium tagluense]MBW9159657.1 hypothetical protein [Clostridium tagluense]WLC68415.1 hypothetical protein KTC93_25775 [Clostridium tagluense]
MKKNLVLILCLSLIFILVGCNSDKKANKPIKYTNENQTLEDGSKDINNPIQATNEQNSIDEKKETDSNNTNSIQSTKISPNKQVVKDKNNVSQKITKVNKKIKLYQGNYLDDRYFVGDLGESTKNYCEVVISNVTNTSFDFTVHEIDRKTKNKNVIFLRNTAVFTGDGTQATFYGHKYTLNFTFPYVTTIEISGFKPLQGNTYANNKIPGHK